MAGENRIGIEFAQTGAKDVVTAAQQTSAAVKQANDTAATTAKASGEAQTKASDSIMRGFTQIGTAVMGYLGVMKLAQEAWSAFLEVAKQDTAINRVVVSMQRMGIATQGVREEMDALGTTFIQAGQREEAAWTGYQRLVQATGDAAKAQSLLRDALRFATRQGEDAGAVADALSRAYSGQQRQLIQLLTAHGSAGKEAKNFAEALDQVRKLGEGANSVISTQEQAVNNLAAAWDSAKDSLGKYLKGPLTDLLTMLATFAQGAASAPEDFKRFLYWLTGGQERDIAFQNAAGTFGSKSGYSGTEWDKIVAELARPSPKKEPRPFGGDAGGGAAGDTGAKFDRSAYADMVNQETAFAQLAADNQIEIARYKRERLVEITGGEVSMQTAIYQRGFLAYKAMIDDALKKYAAWGIAAGNIAGGTINGMTNLWSDYFANLGNKEIVQRNMWAESGKLFLAMVLNEVKQVLQTKAVEHATYAGALWAGAIFNPLLIPAALGETAVAAALGLGAIGAGVGSSLLTPKGAQTVIPVEEQNPLPGGGGGGSYGGYGSAPQGGQTISNSNVTIYYNPTMVVSGNVYGMDDFRKLVMGFFQQYAYVRGMDLGTVGG
jgi:hypothetical protein